jgi:hypothetical protein
MLLVERNIKMSAKAPIATAEVPETIPEKIRGFELRDPAGRSVKQTQMYEPS